MHSNFYPRSPCGERLGTLRTVSVRKIFLSTLSLRRATGSDSGIRFSTAISIHALLAESDRKGPRRCVLSGISIHALLAESDVEKVPADVYYQAFLSTLSLRRATPQRSADCNCQNISIHALLAESDRQKRPKHQTQTYFYPRSPCGERPGLIFFLADVSLFLSTLSLRRATLNAVQIVIVEIFLSTLSLRRATRRPIFFWRAKQNFYPRSPCGERRE